MTCASLGKSFSYINYKSDGLWRIQEWTNLRFIIWGQSEHSRNAEGLALIYGHQMSHLIMNFTDRAEISVSLTTASRKPWGETIENTLILRVQYLDWRIFWCCAGRTANVTSSRTTCCSSKISLFLKDGQMQCTVSVCVRTHALKDNKHSAMAASWPTLTAEDVKLAQMEC